MLGRGYDKSFLVVVAILIVFGFLSFFSASMGITASEGEGFYTHILRQIVLGFGLGGILFVIGARTPYKFWRKWALPIFVGSAILTALVFVPQLGFEHGGARRWLNFGFFFFQPAELLKFGIVAYLASWMAARREEIRSVQYGLLPFLVIAGIAGALLIKQPDVGTLGVIAFTALAMFYVGGSRKAHVAFVVFLGLALLAALIAIEPYRMSRFTVFLNPTEDVRGAGYQLQQSKIAIGSGGVFGRGFGKSIQKFEYLPEPTSDSIFSVVAEEWGFVGAAFLIILFLAFLWRGLRIAKNAPDVFGRLFASGIVIMVVVQAYLHIAALSGLIPLTGLPLVFVSKGGSSLAISLFLIGIVLNVSKHSKN
ncbi:MAG: putative lipid II flippase FtsW [Candidatus Niyogibacteria bacterium]|nr:putative lipid II flippase FtsW [Candidatus Niyogibacteria bacterium]